MKVLEFLDKIQSLIEAIKIIVIVIGVMYIASVVDNVIDKIEVISQEVIHIKTELTEAKEYFKSPEFKADALGVKENLTKGSEFVTDLKSDFVKKWKNK